MEFQDGIHVGQLVFENGTNLVSNLAQAVSYHPVKFQTDRLEHLRVRVWKQNFKMVALCFSKWHQLRK